MAFKILDVDKFLQQVKAKTVSDPQTFDRNMEPKDAGLQSRAIFGISSTDKFGLWGAINLEDVILHPLVYDNLSSIDPAFKRVIEKTKSYEIVNGMLHENPNGKNGLSWLISNWDKLNLERYRTEKNKLFIDMLKNTKDLIFVNRVPVIPIGYREAHMGSFKMEESEIDALYKKILSMSKSGRSDFTSTFMEKIKTMNSKEFIQDAVNQLYKYFISKLESKRGFYRSTLTAKRLDNVSRMVANARPDIPINSCVIPWQILLNMFDVFVLGYLQVDEKNEGDLKKRLGVSTKGIDEFGEHLDYIYRNAETYDRHYPERKKIWIEILVNIFNENPLLRVFVKRDPGWNADSLWCFQPLINSDNMYNIYMPSWVYSPLGGDSFTSNFIPDYKKDKVIFEDDDYLVTGELEQARTIKTMDSIWKRLQKYQTV